MNDNTVLESILERDRTIVLSGVIVICALAWGYMFSMAPNMSGMAMTQQTPAWHGADLLWLFIMWAVMMVAMMTPSVAPLILTFAAVNRKRKDSAIVPTSVFLSGYLISWAGFSLLAALAQWSLHSLALLSPMMASKSSLLSGALLMTAGVYQWMPWKQACLKHCRSPLDFIMSHWKEGTKGALVMGLGHGVYCVGCCWALMILLFVTGVMNLLWVAVIAGFVLLEKVLPHGPWAGRATGVMLVAFGVWVMI